MFDIFNKDNKYSNLILLLCKRLGGSIVGKKKLAKLLYYVDFDMYEYNESMTSISGDVYEAWQMGPVPKRYMDIVDSLMQKNLLEEKSEQIGNTCQYLPAEVFTALADPEDVFDDNELKIIDRVVNKYGNLNGKQLEVLTHQEAPYIGTPLNEEIAYELALYRGTDFGDVLATS
jgi:uncharacterized phage-associated protein